MSRPSIRTVHFQPTVVNDFDPALGRAYKIVGVSDDHELLARCESELQAGLGEAASASRSQPYYLDITHPRPTRASALHALAALMGVPMQRDRGDRRRPQRRRHVRAKRASASPWAMRRDRGAGAGAASSPPPTTRTASPRPIREVHPRRMTQTAPRSPRRRRRARPARGRSACSRRPRGGKRWRVLRRSVGRLDAEASLPAARRARCPSRGRGRTGSGATSASCRPDDPASNYRMTREALLSHVPVPADHIHPVPTLGITPGAPPPRNTKRPCKAFHGAEHPDARPAAVRRRPAGPRHRRPHGVAVSRQGRCSTRRRRWVGATDDPARRAAHHPHLPCPGEQPRDGVPGRRRRQEGPAARGLLAGDKTPARRRACSRTARCASSPTARRPG